MILHLCYGGILNKDVFKQKKVAACLLAMHEPGSWFVVFYCAPVLEVDFHEPRFL